MKYIEINHMTRTDNLHEKQKLMAPEIPFWFGNSQKSYSNRRFFKAFFSNYERVY